MEQVSGEQGTLHSVPHITVQALLSLFPSIVQCLGRGTNPHYTPISICLKCICARVSKFFFFFFVDNIPEDVVLVLQGPHHHHCYNLCWYRPGLSQLLFAIIYVSSGIVQATLRYNDSGLRHNTGPLVALCSVSFAPSSISISKSSSPSNGRFQISLQGFSFSSASPSSLSFFAMC